MLMCSIQISHLTSCNNTFNMIQHELYWSNPWIKPIWCCLVNDRSPFTIHHSPFTIHHSTFNIHHWASADSYYIIIMIMLMIMFKYSTKIIFLVDYLKSWMSCWNEFCVWKFKKTIEMIFVITIIVVVKINIFKYEISMHNKGSKYHAFRYHDAFRYYDTQNIT